MPHHRNHRAMTIDPDQFDTVSQGGLRYDTRRHDGRLNRTVPVVAQPEAVPHFMQDHVALKFSRKRGKIVRVNTNQTRAIREGRRPCHPLGIDVLGGLVELDSNVRSGEPDPPENECRSDKCCKHGIIVGDCI